MNGSAPLQNGKDKAAVRQSHALQSAPASCGDYQVNGRRATYYGHDREEITRLLMQTLIDLGFTEAAESVSENSGFALESQAVAAFRQAVLGGNWLEAEQLLLGPSAGTHFHPNFEGSTRGATSSAVGPAEGLVNGAARSAPYLHGQALPDASGGLSLVPGADRDLMRFGIRQQKYLECLQEGDIAKALLVLRNELTPLHQDKQRLQFLSSLLMCKTSNDLMARAKWDGAYGQSRPHLLSELSRFVSPSVMLPEHRLAVLLRQTTALQVSGCVFHTASTPPSLYTNHACDKSNFPTHVLCEFSSKSGEVWQVRFSGDGKYLASCGSGHYVNIYEAPSFKLKMRLDGHSQGVGDIAWSPDNSMLVSCGRDGCARLWDMNTGLLIRLFEQFDEPVSGCVWTNDNETIVLGSFDKNRALAQWKVTGERSRTWLRKHRTEALAISPDGLWLVAMDHEKHLHVYNFLTQELEYDMELNSRAVSIAISEDSQFLLVLRQDGEIHMYNIRVRGEPVYKYTGATVGDCVIRATFGGANESFVISGSEDGNLNIWHKNFGAHLFRLEAHKPRCNAISWSPTDPCLFATCGDDGKIKIWSSSERVRQGLWLE
ncbi:hypothetical protein SEPCBS119000_000305 [Sporothrix epigloea]|uniref:Uncharacterized protein n=1 Tax=Sporothrix epigloea TaxID=1892477 RepID=A0ABP0D4F5_9PEZI